MNEYGLSFPIIVEEITNNSGNLVSTPAKPGLQDSIESSIRIILAYQIGRRNFLSSFGSILESLVGAPNAGISRNAVSVFVTKVVEDWERRITVNETEVDQTDEYITIAITGFIKEIRQKFNYQILV